MRIKKLQNKLFENNIDCLVVTNKVNRRYLCGFTGSNGLLLVALNRVILLVDGRYIEQAQQQTSEIEIRIKSLTKSLYSLLEEFTEYKTWGFEGEDISFNVYQDLKVQLQKQKGELIETTNLIERLRMIKSVDEINAMKEAARISDATLKEIIPLIEPGMTELELANEIDYRSKKLGSENPAFETIVASGKRTAMPHAHASQKKIQRNELIMIDFGSIYKGYYSDITRTFGFGEVPEKVKEMYKKLLDIQKKIISLIELDMNLSNLHKLAKKELAQVGLADLFVHNLGHGIGLSCHEFPDLGPKSLPVVQQNMVFTIEPGVYIQGEFGIRIEDDVWVKENGSVECLTKFTKEWIEIK